MSPSVMPRGGNRLIDRPNSARDLLPGATNRRRGAHDLGRLRRPGNGPFAQVVDGGLVQAHHGAERAADEVQLVLHDEFGRQQPLRQGLGTRRRVVHDAVGTVRVDVGGLAEEHAGLAAPRHHRELVDRADDEARDFLVDLLVDEEDGQSLAPRTWLR